MLEEYLGHFVHANQKNWIELLDVAQFCFNSKKSSATNKSAFEIVTGQQPILPHTVQESYKGKNPKASNFTRVKEQYWDSSSLLGEGRKENEEVGGPRTQAARVSSGRHGPSSPWVV